MGDKILKKTTLLLILSCSLFANKAEVDLSWVDKEIEAIKPPRKGISDKIISRLEDPFIFLKNKEDEKNKAGQKNVSAANLSSSGGMPRASVHQRPLKLMAILNDTALINGKWYKLGDKVRNYKIVKITMTEVILKSPVKKLVLTTNSKKLKVGHKK